MKLRKIGKTGFVCFVVIVLGTGIFLSQAFADYPNKPITFVVGFAPGGGMVWQPKSYKRTSRRN